LSNFADVEGLTSDIRQSVVITTPLGIFTVKDLERLLDQGSIEMNGVTVTDAQFEQVIADQRKSEGAPALELPQQIIAQIEALQKPYSEKNGPGIPARPGYAVAATAANQRFAARQ